MHGETRVSIQHHPFLASCAPSLAILAHLQSVLLSSLSHNPSSIIFRSASFLYGGEGINFLFSLIMLYRASNSLESQLFHLRTADYSFALGLMASGILVSDRPQAIPCKLTRDLSPKALNVKLGGMIFHRPLFMAILYLEAQANPEALYVPGARLTPKQSKAKPS